MLRDDDVVLIISNAPDGLLAKRIAHVLVEDGLAACVNLGQAVLSVYRWKGEIEGAEEVPLTIKTTYGMHQAVGESRGRRAPHARAAMIVFSVIGGGGGD